MAWALLSLARGEARRQLPATRTAAPLRRVKSWSRKSYPQTCRPLRIRDSLYETLTALQNENLIKTVVNIFLFIAIVTKCNTKIRPVPFLLLFVRHTNRFTYVYWNPPLLLMLRGVDTKAQGSVDCIIHTCNRTQGYK